MLCVVLPPRRLIVPFFQPKTNLWCGAVCPRSGGAIQALYRKEMRVSSYIAPACGRIAVKKTKKRKVLVRVEAEMV